MYNGVGLTTPRGSGTNGYVQRNLAFISTLKDKAQTKPEDDYARTDAVAFKEPNKDILFHERKRKIEVKCFEMQEQMEEQGYTATEIEIKIGKFRIHLLKEMEQNETALTEKKSNFFANFPQSQDTKNIADTQRLVPRGTHETAAVNLLKNNVFKDALGIGDNFQEGTSMASLEEKRRKDEINKLMTAQGNFQKVESSEEEEGEMKKKKKKKKSKKSKKKSSKDKKKKKKAKSSSSESSSSSSDSDSSSSSEEEEEVPAKPAAKENSTHGDNNGTSVVTRRVSSRASPSPPSQSRIRLSDSNSRRNLRSPAPVARRPSRQASPSPERRRPTPRTKNSPPVRRRQSRSPSPLRPRASASGRAQKERRRSPTPDRRRKRSMSPPVRRRISRSPVAEVSSRRRTRRSSSSRSPQISRKPEVWQPSAPVLTRRRRSPSSSMSPEQISRTATVASSSRQRSSPRRSSPRPGKSSRREDEHKRSRRRSSTPRDRKSSNYRRTGDGRRRS